MESGSLKLCARVRYSLSALSVVHDDTLPVSLRASLQGQAGLLHRAEHRGHGLSRNLDFRHLPVHLELR